ncbi:MAG: alpha/beta hydrolase [Desulfobacterales bacterium]|nr:MAG: alpha/beta hydrolase [Desulfobacterales bacterium]
MLGIIIGLIIIILVIYFLPTPKVSFQKIYATVPADTSQSLQAFRSNHPLNHLIVEGIPWNYIRLGQGPETILLLHGMAGSYDIWWQQIKALQDRFRIIAPTYPPVQSLAKLKMGVMTILEKEQVDRFNVVGSSLGGYLAQYLVDKQPDRIKKAVFANTFPPNNIIIKKFGRLERLRPLFPSWALMLYFRKATVDKIYPASGNSELLRAYLLEQFYGRMSKAQVVARYRCVIDSFEPPGIQSSGIPILIIEADNDPLLEEPLREMLKRTYPSAEIKTLPGSGHFPYLNRADEYSKILKEFFNGS